jgi:hypothetical protein
LALKRALMAYYADEWRDDFRDLWFVLDGKLPGKLAPGEKFLERMVMPAISYDERFALGVLDTWAEDPVHPFVAKYNIDEGIDARVVFEHGLQFADSREHAGLQLVDAVAYTVRRAILQPANEKVQRAYDSVRRLLLNEESHALSLVTYEAGRLPAADLYRPLYNASRG